MSTCTQYASSDILERSSEKTYLMCYSIAGALSECIVSWSQTVTQKAGASQD